MSIYHDEYGNVKPPSAFTEFAGGILDSYYHRISAAEREVEELKEERDRLQLLHRDEIRENKNLTTDRDTWRKEAKAAEARAVTVKAQIEAQATEIARIAKVVEQYAAWRVAVREALKDLPEGRGFAALDDVGTLKVMNGMMSVLERIEELTAEKPEENA